MKYEISQEEINIVTGGSSCICKIDRYGKIYNVVSNDRGTSGCRSWCCSEMGGQAWSASGDPSDYRSC